MTCRIFPVLPAIHKGACKTAVQCRNAGNRLSGSSIFYSLYTDNSRNSSSDRVLQTGMEQPLNSPLTCNPVYFFTFLIKGMK
ncbi:MAG: hypothetical protein EA364_02940 [Balneolaceae bacterium]|nr:MAG: hypothetical protein EA364_02940 [Balneolaceae bacterium]